MSIKSKLQTFPGYNQLVLPLHWLQALAAARKYHYPARNLRVIAVTGTNGKTTTSFMIWKMLNHAGYRTGLLSTAAWGIDDVQEDTKKHIADEVIFDEMRESSEQHKETYSEVRRLRSATADNAARKENKSLPLHKQLEHMTTERVEILNQRIKAIADAGAEFLVLETTSHALVQFRTFGIPIEVAVFTNLTHEHLDYHKTFANYRAAKLKLFKQSKFGIVNADDPNAHYFTEIYPPNAVKTYGIKHGNYRATDIQLTSTGVNYLCDNLKISTQIPGEFNVYNSLAALAVGKYLHLTDEEITKGIHSLKSVEGRMNRLDEGQDFEVIVDYAHTPDALEKVFTSVQGHPDKIIALHGGAGRRDESTRFLRGEVLGKYADTVIITEDDSRDEDPTTIAQPFLEGAEKAGKVKNQNLFLNLDRDSAIHQALTLAQPGDLVLLLGKGHEKTILRADGPHDFEDIKVATKYLRELQK